MMKEETDLMINELHEHWRKVESNCLDQKHKTEVRYIDFGHVQVILACEDCLKKGKIEHQKIAKKYKVL